LNDFDDFALTPPFAARGELGWIAPVAAERLPADAEGRARLVLREDGRALGPANAMEADIRAEGAGHYAVWPDAVCFSASDSSDPNSNGRSYLLTARPAAALPALEMAEAPLAAWAAPETPLKVAILGLGARGLSFAERLSALEGVEIAWIADRDPERLERAPAPGARRAADLAAPIADPEVAAVFVTAPDVLHRDLAVAAFAAGKHVFLEKPMATTEEGARAILAAWRASGRILRLGYVLRHAPFYQAVRRVTAEGALGPIHTLEIGEHLGLEHGASYMRRWHRDSAVSGGLMTHKGCHDLDLVCWLLDDRPARVASFGGDPLFSRPAPASHCSVCPERAECPFEDRGAYEARTAPERADPAAAGLDVCVFGHGHDIVSSQVTAFEMAGGTRGVYALAMNNPGRRGRTLTLLGRDGRLDGDFDTGTLTVTMRGVSEPAEWTAPGTGQSGHGGGDERALRGFLEACAGRAPAEAESAEAALRGLAFAFAAEAARTGGRVIEVAGDLSFAPATQ
jgi:predicted dehydrogenase